jgi:hypothetical protein
MFGSDSCAQPSIRKPDAEYRPSYEARPVDRFGHIDEVPESGFNNLEEHFEILVRTST